MSESPRRTFAGPRRRGLLAAVAAISALLVVSGPVQAHDYWLEFAPLRPAAGDELALSLWVGEDFAPTEEKPMQRARMVALRHITRDDDVDLLPGAREGATPLQRVKLHAGGGHLLAVERDPSHITLRALKFNKYLKHEGLLAALAERRRAGERLRRASERYTRYLKAFVQVGDEADGVSTRVVGHRIELVPERDLATLAVGERLALAVRFEGKALPGVQVEAFVRGPDGRARGQVALSDAAGRVEFVVGAGGAWVVRTVHMQRCTGCADAQWESFWTAYSFAVR